MANRRSALRYFYSFKPYIEKMNFETNSGGNGGTELEEDIRIRVNPIVCYAGNDCFQFCAVFLRRVQNLLSC